MHLNLKHVGLQEVFGEVNGNKLDQVMVKRKWPKYWNVIDADARKQDHTRFTMPDVVKQLSLNELHGDKMHDQCRADREANYLLVSEGGAYTGFHQDMTHTSVFYFLGKGSKTFYLVRPTPKNQELFNAYLAVKKWNVFFGGHPDLQRGCVKVVLKERQGIFMPGGMIHAVETTGLSIALGKSMHSLLAAYDVPSPFFIL